MCPNDESLSHVKRDGMSKSVLEKDSEKHILDEFLGSAKRSKWKLQKNDPISFVHG